MVDENQIYWNQNGASKHTDKKYIKEQITSYVEIQEGGENFFTKSLFLSIGRFKYYLKHEHECCIRYKTRGAAERFISDKARIASVLNSFKNDPFYTHLVTLFTKEFSI